MPCQTIYWLVNWPHTGALQQAFPHCAPCSKDVRGIVNSSLKFTLLTFAPMRCTLPWTFESMMNFLPVFLAKARIKACMGTPASSGAAAKPSSGGALTARFKAVAHKAIARNAVEKRFIYRPLFASEVQIRENQDLLSKIALLGAVDSNKRTIPRPPYNG